MNTIDSVVLTGNLGEHNLNELVGTINLYANTTKDNAYSIFYSTKELIQINPRGIPYYLKVKLKENYTLILWGSGIT